MWMQKHLSVWGVNFTSCKYIFTVLSGLLDEEKNLDFVSVTTAAWKYVEKPKEEARGKSEAQSS